MAEGIFDVKNNKFIKDQRNKSLTKKNIWTTLIKKLKS